MGEQEGRRFWVSLEAKTGRLRVSTNPPRLSRLLPDKTPREVVEMTLDTESTDGHWHLAELWVANTISLDEILEQLKSAPRIHSADISGTKQSVAAASGQLTNFAAPTSSI
jgi:hypothetical protein